MNVQVYELERLRVANVELTLALEATVVTIERLSKEHRLFHADRVLALAKTALKNNKR